MEKAASEDTMINNAPLQDETVFGRSVDAALPRPASDEVEIFRMLRNKQRLGLSVASLLLEVGLEVRAAVMPDKTGGAKSDLVTEPLQTPAKIDIIAGLAKSGIKAVDFFQGRFVKGHVAAGNVLGFFVGKHDVSRSAG